MNFLSKDAPLHQSIAAMQTILTEMSCQITFSQEIQPLKYCYSVNITSAEAPHHIYANGKGITAKAALASGLGEYIERLQTNNFFSDFYLPDRAFYPDQISVPFKGEYLNTELRAFYDPDGELLAEDLSDFNSDEATHITALPFINQTSGKTVYFPINILNNLYVSNGLASGNSPMEAQVQALSEILERYVKIKIIKKGYSLPQIPLGQIKSLPKLYHDITALQERGFTIKVLDASLGGRFPVTAISLINPNHPSLFVSFGAHPILEVALERTMTELMQGRGLDTLDTFETPTFDMDVVADSFNLESHFIDSNGKMGFSFLNRHHDFPYIPWEYTGQGCKDEHQFLGDIIAGMDRDIYLREYTYLGFYSCQIVIPHVSEIYPIDDLLYANRNAGKWLRQMVLRFPEHDPKEIMTAVAELDQHLELGHYIGVIFKQPFTVLELKAQLHLLLDAPDEAMDLLEFSEAPIAQVLVELFKMAGQQLNWSDYQDGLYAVFGQEMVHKGQQILEGKSYLIDTTLDQQYQNMLNLYDRLSLKKQSHTP